MSRVPPYFSASEAEASVASASPADGVGAASSPEPDIPDASVGPAASVPAVPDVGDRLVVDRVAGHLRVGRRSGLGGRVVQQPGLHDLLRTGVPALAHTRTLADATAQVVELRPADVAAGRDLDPLDLRRVHWEGALHADAERLLAHGERLADALTLALDDDTLEDLRTAAGALDDLEVDAHPIAGLELRDPTELRALEAVDDGAHDEKKPREPGRLSRARLW
jgi:hypothetical protein